MARLAALVPRPRVHLTRYHGVFAPHSRWRAEVTPAGRGTPQAAGPRPLAERHRAMRWAQRLKRVFGIEIETCAECGGKVRVIASVAGAPDRPDIPGPGANGCAAALRAARMPGGAASLVGSGVSGAGGIPGESQPTRVAGAVPGWQTPLMGGL